MSDQSETESISVVSEVASKNDSLLQHVKLFGMAVLLFVLNWFIRIPKLLAIIVMPYIYIKVLKALFRRAPEQSLKEERQAIESSNLLNFTEVFKMIYKFLNAYTNFIRELILLKQPIKNFVQTIGLLVLSIFASKMGDWLVVWSYLFFLLIPPLLNRKKEVKGETIKSKSEMTFAERHSILAKFIPYMEFLESLVPRYNSFSQIG